MSTEYFEESKKSQLLGRLPKVIFLCLGAIIFLPQSGLRAGPSISGFYLPDIGDAYKTRGFSASGETALRFSRDNSAFTARYFFRGFGQVPFDPRSTTGKVFGLGGQTYQNEVHGFILGVEQNVALNFLVRATLRAMNSVVFPGGMDPSLDPLAQSFLMGRSRYLVFGVKTVAGTQDGRITLAVEWGREPAAAKNFVRSRANGQFILFRMGSFSWRLRGMVEDLGGKPPFAEAVRIGGSATLRGFTPNRYLGDRGAGLSLGFEKKIRTTKWGSVFLVAYGDLSRAWSKDLTKSGGPALWSDWGKSVGVGIRHVPNSEARWLPYLQLDFAVGMDPWSGAERAVVHLELQPWSTDWLQR